SEGATTLSNHLFKNYDPLLSPYNSRSDLNGSSIRLSLMRARLTGVNDRQMEFRSIVNFGVRLTRQPVFWISLVVMPTFLLGTLVMIGVFYGATPENVVNNAVR
ncbi:hypothetical protein PFISCL1PPCAC_18022, partial [Pristionchus fissidentatus]